MAHNVALPNHRYVYVIADFVVQDSKQSFIPAVWFGIGSTPQRSLSCHVLLENGAMIVDLPLHALRWKPVSTDVALSDVVAWDCYGWNVETYQPSYISGLSCKVLDSNHHMTTDTGTMWFAIDFIDNGFSDEPSQHKHLWVIARERDGAIMLLPQDRVLIHEASFTNIQGIPRIKRQDNLWVAEN